MGSGTETTVVLQCLMLLGGQMGSVRGGGDALGQLGCLDLCFLCVLGKTVWLSPKWFVYINILSSWTRCRVCVGQERWLLL